MEYTTFVQMLRSDRTAAITTLLEQHGDALYDYSLALLGDRLEATSALHDAILLSVVRSDRLRRQASFVPWLFALVRYEADRRQRRDAVTVLHAEPRRPSRWRAASARDDAAAAFDHEQPGVLDLVFRHRFGTADVAAVLGIDTRRALRLVARARAVGAPVAGTCATVPFAELPPSLLAQVLESAADTDRMALLAVPVDRLDRGGFPGTARQRAYRRPVAVVVGAALVLLLVTAGVVLTDDSPAQQRADPPLAPEPDARQDGPGPVMPASLPPSSPSPSVSSGVANPATIRRSATPTPPIFVPVSPTADPVPIPSVTTSPAASPAVTITVSPRTERCRPRWRARVEIVVTGATARQVTVTWTWPGESLHTTNGTPDSAGRFTTTVTGLPRQTPVSFQGSAVSVQDQRGQSSIVTREIPRCKNNDGDAARLARRPDHQHWRNAWRKREHHIIRFSWDRP